MLAYYIINNYIKPNYIKPKYTTVVLSTGEWAIAKDEVAQEEEWLGSADCYHYVSRYLQHPCLT